MTISNKTYDILKWIVCIVLPAFTTLYSTIAICLNLPFTEQVVTIMVAVTTFLGVILGFSTYEYNKKEMGVNGTLIIDQANPDMPFTELKLDEPISDVADSKNVTLKIDTDTPITNPSLYISE